MNKRLAQKVARRIRESGLMYAGSLVEVVPFGRGWIVEVWGTDNAGEKKVLGPVIRKPEDWTGVATFRALHPIGSRNYSWMQR